jgi:hypothetical protein
MTMPGMSFGHKKTPTGGYGLWGFPERRTEEMSVPILVETLCTDPNHVSTRTT